MSNVKSLQANNNLENIPHMLRSLANDIERGEEMMPKTMILVSIVNPDFPPVIFQFGEEGSRLEQIGALAQVQSMMMGIEDA